MQAAAAYRESGKFASSHSAATLARQLADQCEGARTLGLVGYSLKEDLTGREREVALLASRGLPSHAIAERLVVSPRTVENHLQHIYRKLSVTTRHELRSVLDKTQ